MAVTTNDVSLFLEVAEMAKELDSLYRNNRTGREDFLEFMDANDWFDVTYVTVDNAPVVQRHDIDQFRKPLTLWLSAYKKPGREKVALMLEYFSDIYPQTCMLFQRFATDRQIENEPATWKLLDFLLSGIDREITEYSEDDLEQLVKRADAEVTRLSAKLLADFLRTGTHNGRPITGQPGTHQKRLHSG